LLTRRPPRSPLFPYTTLFRSSTCGRWKSATTRSWTCRRRPGSRSPPTSNGTCAGGALAPAEPVARAGWLLAVVASVALLATSAGPAPAPSLVARTDPPPLGATEQRHWVGAWATAPVRERHDERRGVGDQSFRIVARLTLGGPRLRARLSNVYGSDPVTFTQVRVALRVSGPAVDPATDHQARCGGKPRGTDPAGREPARGGGRFPPRPGAA